jgi:hypothetical protein
VVPLQRSNHRQFVSAQQAGLKKIQKPHILCSDEGLEEGSNLAQILSSIKGRQQIGERLQYKLSSEE